MMQWRNRGQGSIADSSCCLRPCLCRPLAALLDQLQPLLVPQLLRYLLMGLPILRIPLNTSRGKKGHHQSKSGNSRSSYHAMQYPLLQPNVKKR